MNPYLWLPLLSGLACLAFAVLVWAREPWATGNRVLAAILTSGAAWGVAEALWTVAPDAHTALAVLRWSVPCWALLGPLALHLMVARESTEPSRLHRYLPLAYLIAGSFAPLSLLFPMHSAMTPVAWGWAYRPTGFYAAWWSFTVVCAGIGYGTAVAGIRRAGSPAERQQSPWLAIGIGLPLFVGGVTDGFLPLVGVQVPRTGPACIALLGASVAWSLRRFGYTVLAPGAFAAPILSTLRDGLALATPDGRIRYANPALAVLIQAEPEELIDEPLARFLPDAGLAPPREIREMECELRGNGASPVPVALSALVLRDRRGMLIGLVVLLRDLREVLGLRKGLLTSARLAAVGQLAAGIAHEINNPLAYIGANLRALREQWTQLAGSWRDGAAEKPDLDALFDDGLAMLDESLEGVDRTATIVRDVRVFSHGGSERRERLAPNDLLEHALRVAEPHVRRRARVERAYGDVPPVEGSRRELEQVLLNLLINAAQAIEGGGIVRVSTAFHGGEVEIAVADTGCGIPGELLERIFDPFFTTKPAGEGTGLGLSISHEIVRRHGGRILVDSDVGRGTQVRIRLPAAQ
jgi:signal transduction histidine kinase